MAKKQTKKEQIEEAVTEAVRAGVEYQLQPVDFSNPQRPKSCLEVDFPILPINLLAGPEMASGAAKKPVYTWQKWWARRSSHVFRAALLGAVVEAPESASEAAKLVWDIFYGNHNFSDIQVADIFMGGGTTVVEASRLGMTVIGNDLSPVAWFVVKNEIARCDRTTIDSLLTAIEEEVRPRIMPFYACECPRGHKGHWTRLGSDEVVASSFDPTTLSYEERGQYEYSGPEVIYTFWAKHILCQATECSHRTPIISKPLFAIKTISVKAWTDRLCSQCNESFDIELLEARMAPSVPLVVAEDESPYAVMDHDGNYACPHCSHQFRDPVAAATGKSASLPKAKGKNVNLSLLIHPQWLRGAGSVGSSGEVFGGSVTDSPESTASWNAARRSQLRLIEVRGMLPEQITCPETGETFYTDARGGNVPRQSTVACSESTCGLEQDVLTSIRESGRTGPVAMYAIQGYCPECDEENHPYGGRFFDLPESDPYDAALREWIERKDADLAGLWPTSEVPYGFMTHHNNGGIPNHGFTHWHTMFNPVQLLIHTQMLSVIRRHLPNAEAEIALGIWQKYLQHDCMFCFWDDKQDCLAPHFSNNNYHPKHTPVTNNPFTKLGRGNWQSSVTTFWEAYEWCENPWDLVRGEPFAGLGVKSKTLKIRHGDRPVRNGTPQLTCGSASELQSIPDASIDIVTTDPPFGGLLHYSELADFYYVWLRLLLRDSYPELFSSEYCPKVLEAVSNKARHPDNPDAFYQRLLTACWSEAARILKPGGLLTFTFHHSEDEPWIQVLESLFDAGFYLEAAYPIRSDETKGEGSKPGTIGSQKIEYDILHVCRKRTGEPEEISWARLRRQLMKDVRQLEAILKQHESEGLQQADLQVIRRGKALEHFSRHYGRVYIEKGRSFSVREALVGINSLLDDERDSTTEAPPVDAEPFTRQFLRLFADNMTLPRDQVQKYLRGTGVAPSDFQSRGWCNEQKKVFFLTPPLEFARQWKGQSRSGMSRDMDQAMFLVGACYEDSGIRVQDTLSSSNFKPHPAIGDILDWICRHGGDSEMKQAARTAKQLYGAWESKNKPKIEAQLRLFSGDDAEE